MDLAKIFHFGLFNMSKIYNNKSLYRAQNRMKIQALVVMMILMALIAQTMSSPQGPGRIGSGRRGRGPISLSVPRGPFGRFRRSLKTHFEMKKKITSRNLSGRKKF